MFREPLLILLLNAVLHGSAGRILSTSLRDAANQAHQEIPALRKVDQQRWKQVQHKLLRTAVQQRKMEDSYYYQMRQQQNTQYTETVQEEVSQQQDYNYNYVNQYGSYGSFDRYSNGFSIYDSLWNPSMTENEFGFDISHYSFKYTGCHDVGSRVRAVAKPSRYATFRLCPTGSCSGKSTFGCSFDYGEYIVPVDVLVISLIEHNQARVAGYCKYCERCAALESYKQFASEVLMHKQYILNYADARFKTWCSQNGYSSLSESTYRKAAQALWKEMRNGNYASNYVSNSNGYVSSSSYANGKSSSQSWNFQARSGMSWEYPNEQKSWQSMGYTFGTWYDRIIYPGYYDSKGYFNACWGYNSDEGFICLDTTDDTVYWDKNIFGSEPYKWANFTENGYIVDRDDYCDSRYASSCYNQYDACMEILGETESTSYAATTARSEKKLSLSSLLSCKNITEDFVEYDALSFYSQWMYVQKRNKDDQEEIEEYNKQMYRSGHWDTLYKYVNTSEPGLYVGPTCGRDGMTIKLAVYGDPNCTSRVKSISVKELIGYDPLSEDTDIFPNDCISCSPPEDEVVWYETEDVDDPVLPFCSMLYQLSGKCNLGLKPSGRYNPESLYAFDEDPHFLLDTCTVISALNTKHQKRQSIIKRLADRIRMSQKAMSPVGRAFLVIFITLVCGVGVAWFLMRHMKRLQIKIVNLQERIKDIPEIPSFHYQNLGMNRQDSGVEKARQERSRKVHEKRMARARTTIT